MHCLYDCHIIVWIVCKRFRMQLQECLLEPTSVNIWGLSCVTSTGYQSHRVQFKVLLIIHKSIHHHNSPLADSIIMDTHSRRTPNSLRIPFTRSSIGPRLWNQLPLQLRVVNNTSVFKKNLKTLLFRQCFFTWFYNIIYNCFSIWGCQEQTLYK